MVHSNKPENNRITYENSSQTIQILKDNMVNIQLSLLLDQFRYGCMINHILIVILTATLSLFICANCLLDIYPKTSFYLELIHFLARDSFNFPIWLPFACALSTLWKLKTPVNMEFWSVAISNEGFCSNECLIQPATKSASKFSSFPGFFQICFQLAML